MTEKEFISGWVNKLLAEGLKKFPDDFSVSSKSISIELPGKTLVIGEEFFGSYEILTVDGTSIHHSGNHDEAKFLIYSNREKPALIQVPVDTAEIKSANTNYENYLDTLIKRIESDFKSVFPTEKNFNQATNEVFRILNLVRY